MLKVIYRSGGFYIYQTEGNISGGIVATFVGDRKVKLCDDKSIPCGFILDDYQSLSQTRTHATLCIGQAELVTDIFEKNEYKTQDFLYCSVNGKISNEVRYKGNIIIGIVNSVLENEIGFITCFARYLEN
jgi:hypothetical protein